MSECKKTSWPELVGIPVDAAKQKILYDCPDLDVQLVLQGSIVTTDFNPKRVRVFFDKYRRVAEVPKTG